MDDLVTWLRAQLDDDEWVARAVRSGPWRTVTIPDRSGPDTVLELGGTDDRVVSTGFFDDDPLRPTEAEHIARWDPARVLAEVDAKRRLLESHASVVGGQGFRDGDGYGEISPACSACGTHDEYATPWPCYTVRLLALPYADQPGWREEWRP